MRAIVFVLALVLLALGRAPGFLLNLAVQKISRDEIRIGEIEGLLWHGRGVIDVLDVVSHSWHPWREIRWEFVPTGLVQGKLRWRLASGGEGISVVEVGFGGWVAKDLQIKGPARYFLQRLPMAYARTGWGGEVELASQTFACSWAERCIGVIDVKWLNASWELLPTLVFGDYEIQATGRNDDVMLVWHTIKGDVRIEGGGTIGRGHAFQLDAEVSGNPVLLARLPAIAGPWAKQTNVAGTWRITYP